MFERTSAVCSGSIHVRNGPCERDPPFGGNASSLWQHEGTLAMACGWHSDGTVARIFPWRNRHRIL